MNTERLENAVIQWECQQLLNRVTMLMDQQQWQALAQCYTEDAVLSRPSDPNNPIVGRQAIYDSFTARPARTSAHLIGNPVFTVHSHTHVESHSRVWLASGPVSDVSPVLANKALLIGSFVDQFTWDGAQWLIARRDGSVELKYGE